MIKYTVFIEKKTEKKINNFIKSLMASKYEFYDDKLTMKMQPNVAKARSS